MDWPYRGEKLFYTPCGCADSCWNAEVRSRKDGHLLAVLSSDCEQVLFQIGKHGQPRRVADIKEFEQDDKFERITATLVRELKRRTFP